GTAIGGSVSPLLFGWLIETGSSWKVSGGYVLAAFLLLVAAVGEWKLGIDAERKSLESIADPLSRWSWLPGSELGSRLLPARNEQSQQSSQLAGRIDDLGLAEVDGRARHRESEGRSPILCHRDSANRFHQSYAVHSSGQQTTEHDRHGSRPVNGEHTFDHA